MSISNADLRKQVFGAQAKGKSQQRQMSDAINPASSEKAVIAARILTSARARMSREPAGRLRFADAGKGLAIMLVVVAAMIEAAGELPAGFGFLGKIHSYLQPFAMPAFLVFAGMFLKRSREADWDQYIVRKIFPLGGALLLWVSAVAIFAMAFWQPGTLENGPSLARLVWGQMHLAVLLALLPLFLVLWKLFAGFRTGGIFVCAAIMEILHTNQGGVLVVEAMRGLVYFTTGYCFALNFRALATFTRSNAVPAAAIAAAWAAFNAMLVSVDLPMAYGAQISSLPFASLGLGLAGAAAMTILGELLALSRFGGTFAFIGRNWIAFYAVIPLALMALAGALNVVGLFGTLAEAMAALVTAGLAAMLGLMLLEMREPAPPSATSAGNL